MTLSTISSTDNLAQQRAVANLRVYKVRFDSDAGWYFFTAKSRAAARKISVAISSAEPVAATHNDLQQIACRALTGNY